MSTTLIFDLDGTLIDSSAGILNSLAEAFSAAGLSYGNSLTPSLIGPPLQETLRILCPTASQETLDRLGSSFKAHYDTTGFKQTTPYPGVTEMLQALVDAKIPLHIATNKRHLPTLQILEALGWSGLFAHVLSPDSFSPPLASKAAILAQLLNEAKLVATDCLYIGDRLDDYKAAKKIGIPFALAVWGFEGDGAVFSPDTIRLDTPNADQLMTTFYGRPRWLS